MDKFMKASEQISLFCRLNLNTKKELPIRSSEMGALIYLVKTDGKKTPHALAQFFKVTKAMATNMVTSLLTNGYIQKKQSEVDRRSFLLIPTKKAIDLVEDMYHDYYKTMLSLQTKMGERIFDDFIELLEKANAILWEDKNNG